MKKLLTIVLAAALMCAVAAPAMSAALETKGEMRMRAWYLDNYVGTGKTEQFQDQRLRLFLTWPVSDNVKVQARADILEGVWGYNSTLTAGASDVGNVATQNISFEQANMQFAWPGTPLTFTLGRQDVSWGIGFAAQSDNVDRFKIAAKFAPVTVVLAYDKAVEVLANDGENGQDDSRGYVLAAVADIAGWKAGGLLKYSINESTVDLEATSLLGDLYAIGKAGPVDLKVEVAAVSGKNDYKDNSKDVDLSGTGAYVGAFVPAGPVTIGLEGAYASGDKVSTKDENEGAFSSDYQGPFWSVIFYQNMDYPGYAIDGNTSTYTGDFQVRNAMAGKVSVVANPVKPLTLIFNALYAQANEVADGVDEAMGMEFDFVAVYGITENVSLTAGVGYADLGDYWKGKAGAAKGELPDNPLGAVAAFTTKF